MTDNPLERIEQLERNMQRLEAELDELRTTAGITAHSAEARVAPGQWRQPEWPRPQESMGASMTAWPEPAVGPVPNADNAASQPTFVLGGETVLKWGGVGLVVLAVGFAVSTAISRGWIGPELQLVGAVGVALALIGSGLRLRSTRRAWTHALCVGGVLALFVTVASNLFLDQASDGIAYISTAAIALGGIALARHVPSEWVGAATVLGAWSGWMVIADGEPPFSASLIFVVGLVALGLVLAVEQHWFALRLTTHVIGLMGIMSVANQSESAVERVLVAAAAALLVASLARVPSIGDLSSVWQQLEVQLAIVAPVWSFGIVAMTFDLDSDTAVGTTAIAVAVGGALVAVTLQRVIRHPHFVSILIGASVTLSIGLAVLLSTTAAFVGLAVQGAGLVILARSLDRSVRVTINAAVLVAIAFVFVTITMIDAWADNASVGDDIADIIIVSAIGLAVWQTGERLMQKIGAAVVLALVLLWLGSVLVHVPQGQAAVSVSWAVIGTTLLIGGAMQKLPELGMAGLAVLALTVGKLLTVDLQEVDTLWRAGLFFVVGLAFLRLGFLLPRLTRESPRGPGRSPLTKPSERDIRSP